MSADSSENIAGRSSPPSIEDLSQAKETSPGILYDAPSRLRILGKELRPFCYPAMTYDSHSFRKVAETKNAPFLTYEGKKPTMAVKIEPNIPSVTYSYDVATNEVRAVVPGKPGSLPTLTYDTFPPPSDLKAISHSS